MSSPSSSPLLSSPCSSPITRFSISPNFNLRLPTDKHPTTPLKKTSETPKPNLSIFKQTKPEKSSPATPFTIQRRPQKSTSNHFLPETLFPPSTPKESGNEKDNDNDNDNDNGNDNDNDNDNDNKHEPRKDSIPKKNTSTKFILLGNLKIEPSENSTPGEDEAWTFPLYSGQNIIGSNPGFIYSEDLVSYLQKKITVDLPGISRKHASLYLFETGLVFLRDLDSTNGSFLKNNSDGLDVKLPSQLYFQLLAPYQFRLAKYTCHVCLDYLTLPPTQPLDPLTPQKLDLKHPCIPTTPLKETPVKHGSLRKRGRSDRAFGRKINLDMFMPKSKG